MSEHDCKQEKIIDFIKKSLDDSEAEIEKYHVRTRELEEKFNDMPKPNPKVETMLTEIHQCLIGTYDKKGLITRVDGLEHWRISSTSRVKNRFAWVYGLAASVIGGLIIVIATHFIK